MTRPPANPSVAMTASKGQQMVGGEPGEEPIAGQPNGQHGEGIDRKTQSSDKGHGVQRVVEIDGGPIGCGALAEHVGEGDATEDNEPFLQHAIAPFATALRRSGCIAHPPDRESSGS